jgi:ketosteroid isomerase-like protein
MAQANRELVRQFENGWAGGDLDAVQKCVSADFEFDWTNSIGPFVGVYEGHDGLARFWKELQETWDDFAPHALETIECGPDQLITVNLVSGRGKGSGIPVQARGVMLWTIRDGQIARVKLFQTKEDALGAVGLPAHETVTGP